MAELPPVRCPKGYTAKTLQHDSSTQMPQGQSESLHQTGLHSRRNLPIQSLYAFDKNRISIPASSISSGSASSPLKQPPNQNSISSSFSSLHNSQSLLESVDALQLLCSDHSLSNAHRTSLQEIILNLQLNYYRTIDSVNRTSPVQSNCLPLPNHSNNNPSKMNDSSTSSVVENSLAKDVNNNDNNNDNNNNNNSKSGTNLCKEHVSRRSQSSKRRGHKVKVKPNVTTTTTTTNVNSITSRFEQTCYLDLARAFTYFINGCNPLEEIFTVAKQSPCITSGEDESVISSEININNNNNKNNNNSISTSSDHTNSSSQSDNQSTHNCSDNTNTNTNTNLIKPTFVELTRASEFDVCSGNTSKHHQQSPAFTRNRSSSALQSPTETFNQMNEIMTQTLRYVETIGEVEFDIFNVKEYDGSVMVDEERLFLSVCCSVFANFAFTNNLHLDLHKLIRFLTGCFGCYFAQNAYHNAIHAADALQMLSLFFRDPAVNFLFTDEEILLSFLCILASDVAHPGLHDSSLAAMDHPSVAALGDFATTTHTSLLIFLHELLRDENFFMHEWQHKEG